MSLFDSASLVVTPSGYKEDKLYSIKPTDGSGDVVVTRATTATRVNSDGLIEQVPYNLLQRSEEFNNASWGKTNSTITSNSVTAPNGTLTADTFTTSNVNATIDQNITFQNPCVFSVYVKYIDSQFIQLYAGVSSQARANFDILNGVLGNRGTDTSNSTIESVGNGWYKLTATFINNSGASNIRIKFVSSLTSGWGVASTNAINSAYLWGAQLNTGSSAKEYFPTTDRLDVPRLDYTNSSCPSILVEPQRTNLLTNSDGNLATYTTNSNVTDATNSFNTFANAIQFGDNSLSRLAYKRNFTPTIGTQYTISVFVQMNDNSLPILGITNTTGDFGLIINANLATLNPKVEQLGTTNIYRVSVSRIADSTNTQFGVIKYITQSAKGFRITGIQLEVGSNATSYIPTVASSVTRNADVISKTGISSLIGQTEGTLFVDVNLSVNANERRLLTISNGTETQRIIIWTLNNLLYTTFNAAGVNLGNFPIGTTKIAIGYTISGGSTTYSIKVNNNALVTGTAAAAPNPLSIINLGGNTTGGLQLNDRINSTLIWKERLSNTELAQLTTI